MIKTKDFRSRRERLGLPESRPFQVATRQLSKEEVSVMGYDTSEILDFPVMRMSIQGSFVDYEDGPTGIWILYIETEPKFQNQGRAKYLLTALKRYADQHGKSVIHGTFSEEGEKYLKPIVKRMWGESEDDEDFREIYGTSEVLRISKHYRLIRTVDDKFVLEALGNVHPKKVEINQSDASYLLGLGEDFESAVVMDFGCGVFQGPDLEGEPD